MDPVLIDGESLTIENVHEVAFDRRRVTLHPEAMKKLVEHNMGYALLFRPSVADELRSGRLVALHLHGGPLMGSMILAFRSHPVLPPLVQQFVGFVRAELARDRGRVVKQGNVAAAGPVSYQNSSRTRTRRNTQPHVLSQPPSRRATSRSSDALRSG